MLCMERLRLLQWEESVLRSAPLSTETTILDTNDLEIHKASSRSQDMLREQMTNAVSVIGSTSRLPCIDMPRIDMPRFDMACFGYTCRFHTFHGYVT
jgi:hypothetical protein